MLELCVVGGWVHHSWHMGVGGHRYGGLGGGRGRVAVGRHVKQSQEGLIACQMMPEHFPSSRR